MSEDNKTMEKCPFCKKECTGPHRMVTHIIGKHYKEEEKPIEDIINDLKEELGQINKNAYFILNVIDKLENNILENDDFYYDNDQKESRGFNIDDYLDKENPICREERQYAHFLATKLEQNDKNIVGKLQNKLEFEKIIAVYYECTFMRDYWNANKVTYNKKLKAFVEKNFLIKSKIDIGEKSTSYPNYWEKSHPYARWMTNAKPDIGLLVKNSDEDYVLHFLECKYLSPEDKYKAYSVEEKTQTEIQKEILKFLCSEENGLGMKYGEEQIAAGKNVKLVRFGNGEKAKNGEILIQISELLSK